MTGKIVQPQMTQMNADSFSEILNLRQSAPSAVKPLFGTGDGQGVEGDSGEDRGMSDWRRITLGDLAKANGCTIQTGPFGSQLHKHEYQAEGIGVVNPTHMADRRVSHASVPCVSAEVAARLSKHQVRPGDLLFARRGEIGRHAIITESERGWLCGTGCFLVRVDSPESDSTYLSFYLSTDESVEWAVSSLKCNGTG